MIAIGALKAKNLGDGIDEVSDSHEELYGLDAIKDEDDASRGGPGTRTYSRSMNSRESTIVGSVYKSIKTK